MNILSEGSKDKLDMPLAEHKGEISRRELLKMAVPFGKVEIDKTQCTGCGLCTLDCPTGALSIPEIEDDKYRLIFRYGTCIACGECIKACPEHCLSLEHTLEPDRLNQPSTVLFEDRVVRCRQCNSYVAVEAMINRLRSKVHAARGDCRFELCPSCKIKAQFSPGVDDGLTA